MTITQIISLIVVILLAALGGFFIVKKSKKHDLVKWTLLFLFVAVAFSWIFAGGYYQGAELIEVGMLEQGIADFPSLVYQVIYLAGDKILFLLALGAFYSVLGKNEGYKKLVVKIAKKFEGKEVLFTVLASFVVTLLTAFLSQTFVVLIFVPFLITILLNMRLDKVTAFSVTFGSMLVGLLGTLYGGEGLNWFNYYTQSTVQTAILYRLIVLVVSFGLFNFFNVMHMKKALNNKKVNEIELDPFKVEKTDKKTSTWNITVVLCLLLVLVLLGYVDWTGSFNINVFADFHKWLTELQIGSVPVFSLLLGKAAAAFGAWTMFHATALLSLFSILVALISKINLSSFIDCYLDGFKKMVKPISVLVLAYLVWMVAYASPFVPTITNALFKKVTTFNPYLVSLGALIANVFHIDFGYTGFVVGQFFVTAYASKLAVVHTIFTTMYGLVGIVVPTQAILVVGLSYLDIDYKTWIKHIWIFALAILLILLILFTVMTYI